MDAATEVRDAMTPGRVRRTILEQHRGLRGLFQLAVAHTTKALRGAEDRARLATVVEEIAQRFRDHLALEERILVPVLRDSDVFGPERVRQLIDEHARQREELDTLRAGIIDGWDAAMLATALRSLVTDFFADMLEEERTILTPGILSDDAVAVDQVTR